MAYMTETQLQALGFRRLGQNVRISGKASLYDTVLMEIGDNTRIDDFCCVSGRLSIGRNVHITPMCLVAAGSAGLEIGDFCTLSYGVRAFSQSDDYSGATMTNSTVPARYKKEKKEKVVLERHVIVGAGAIIMPGVTVAAGCAIGAGALVRESTAPWGIYAGVPARRLKDRKRDLLALEQEYREAES